MNVLTRTKAFYLLCTLVLIVWLSDVFVFQYLRTYLPDNESQHTKEKNIEVESHQSSDEESLAMDLPSALTLSKTVRLPDVPKLVSEPASDSLSQITSSEQAVSLEESGLPEQSASTKQIASLTQPSAQDSSKKMTQVAQAQAQQSFASSAAHMPSTESIKASATISNDFSAHVSPNTPSNTPTNSFIGAKQFKTQNEAFIAQSSLEVYQQLSNMTAGELTFYLPQNKTRRENLLKHLYQCVGMQFGVINGVNEQASLTLLSQSSVASSDLLRLTNGALSTKEQHLISAYTPNATKAVRLFPAHLDLRLSQYIKSALAGTQLRQFSAHYALIDRRLVLRDIYLNKQSIGSTWVLSNGECLV